MPGLRNESPPLEVSGRVVVGNSAAAAGPVARSGLNSPAACWKKYREILEDICAAWAQPIAASQLNCYGKQFL